ncbi:hypothetical protein [Ascidiimonas sp. W6]|uniref:hypothetical protein n=1 Tax=Ascidiimonas meishanensis TaxID=3128903 RepID=UPI0030EB6A29
MRTSIKGNQARRKILTQLQLVMTLGIFLFSPIIGDSFYWETPLVSNDIFEDFLRDFSNQNPNELKNITIADNIRLLRIPPYSLELNPADKMAMDEKQSSHESLSRYGSITRTDNLNG